MLVTVESANELIDKFTEMSSPKHYFGYRGHSNSEWALESSLWRFIKSIDKTFGRDDRYDQVTSSLLENYRQNLLVHTDIKEAEFADMDVWQYAQHYDLPTPYIDWSYSAYVALFFALNEPQIPPKEKDNRCVWVIDYSVLQVLNQNIHRELQSNPDTHFRAEDDGPDFESTAEFYPTMERLREINGRNKRIYYQQGFFTEPGKLASIEVWLDRISSEIKTPYIDKPLLKKITFSCSEADRVKTLATLDMMNINYRTLFPDMYGSAKDAVEKTYREFMRPRAMSFSFSRGD